MMAGILLRFIQAMIYQKREFSPSWFKCYSVPWKKALSTIWVALLVVLSAVEVEDLRST